MSQRFIKWGYGLSFFTGIISWYFSVLMVSHPVSHPLLNPKYNTIVFVLFDMIVSESAFVLFIMFGNELED